MDSRHQSFFVHIFAENGAIVGAGFLVGKRHIVTCAHVAANALNLKRNHPDLPAGRIRFDFPFLPLSGNPLFAEPKHWLPVCSQENEQPKCGEDLAVLELIGELPAACRPAMITRADAAEGTGCNSYGFPIFPDGYRTPVNYDQDKLAVGKIRSNIGYGVQLLAGEENYVAKKWFSGAPVWDDHQVLVGMIVKAHGSEKEAYLISASALVDAIKSVVPDLIRYDELTQYRLDRINEWSQKRWRIDKRFVKMTLIKEDSHAVTAGRVVAEFTFEDLRDVLARKQDERAFVLLGMPGGGKSTLLRRLQLDHSQERLHEDGGEVTFFVQLNSYKADANAVLPAPHEWLSQCWRSRYSSRLPSFEELSKTGRVLLLLDALNEIPHRDNDDYQRLVGGWRSLLKDLVAKKNRVVISCRVQDYSVPLSDAGMTVRQVRVQPMNPDQMREFLRVYTPAYEECIWNELEKDPEQFKFYQTPYFLDLLCKSVDALNGEIPKGRAELFTRYLRSLLRRECEKENAWLTIDALFTSNDRRKLIQNQWHNRFDLPEDGSLIPKLCDLAFAMQGKQRTEENRQVRDRYEDARDLLGSDRADDILMAGCAFNILDHDLKQNDPNRADGKGDILFSHQLLQEYFAARRLARHPDSNRVHVEWKAQKVRPRLKQVLSEIADFDPLPPPPPTGWEETTLTAAPMASDPERFIRDLIPHNLPLAARCAASPEVQVSDRLKREIRDALIERTQNYKRADLRARISAGQALGEIGDSRFELRDGPHGKYLMPPTIEIPGGVYPMGDDDSAWDDEKPACVVALEPFRIGVFPVTNAEYRYFIEAGGYKCERWWDTEESRLWLKGELGNEVQKADFRGWVRSMSEEDFRKAVARNRFTSQQLDDWLEWKRRSDGELDAHIDEWYPLGKKYSQPEFWEDPNFNQPSQPVVGVTWFEARAYCSWLTASIAGGNVYRLPTEAEFEAAARGKDGQRYPYGNMFDKDRSNTSDSHIRRTAPVGIFDNKTRQGAYDLSGNAWTWTLSIYDQHRFSYPYKSDEREDIHQAGVGRVLRGGSWFVNGDVARAAGRSRNHPAYRRFKLGFRVVCVPLLRRKN